jgi:transcriptional regulator with XRE-family HTH domain
MTKRPMLAAELKAAMKRLKLTLTGAARLLDVDRSAIIRWRNGTRRVPGPVAAYLRHLLAKRKAPTR